MNNLPILTEIKDGQPYVDEPVYNTLNPKKLRKAIQQAMRVHISQPIKILIAYNHVKLRWMEPDGNGGLVPR